MWEIQTALKLKYHLVHNTIKDYKNRFFSAVYHYLITELNH